MIVFLINVTAFVIFCLIGSLIMCGWYKATREKMIFEKWSKFWEKKDVNDNYVWGKFSHPISGCIYCYPSIYGSLIYWIVGACFVHEPDYVHPYSWQVFVLWIVYILSTCALNGIIIKKVL